MNDCPNLPGLEKVKWCGGISGLAAFIGLFLAFSFVFILLCAILDKLCGLPITWQGSVIGVVLLLLLVFLLRTSLYDHRWETTSDGLRIKSIIGGRFLPWTDVPRAETKRNLWWMTSCYTLQSKKFTVIIPARDIYICASIWQHLNSVGLSAEIKLSSAAELFWEPIPDTVQDEVGWEDEKKVGSSMACFIQLLLLIFGTIVTVAFVCFGLWQVSAVVAVGLIVIMLVRVLRSPIIDRVLVGRDTIAIGLATGQGQRATLKMPWGELVSTKWVNYGIDLRWIHGVRVVIPWDPQDPQSTRLIVAIIHRLRGIPRPVLLPFPVELKRKFINQCSETY
ncbi:MAG: hypothetical protein ABFD54_16320 [Armatimonadota bacterium]|nr:PH domain-containing protein [bacterium]